MKPVRIIGIGSPFHNDDIGWRVIAYLRQLDELPETIELVEADRPGIGLLHLLQGQQLVILVDALVQAERHGEIVLLDKAQLALTGSNYSSHGLDVASALRLAEKLQRLPQQLKIVAMAIDPARDTAVDQTAIDRLAKSILAEANSAISETDPCYS